MKKAFCQIHDELLEVDIWHMCFEIILPLVEVASLLSLSRVAPLLDPACVLQLHF